MDLCRACNEKLTEARFLLLDGRAYKSCPKCSKNAGEHVFYRSPDAFGTTEKRITYNNPTGLQSHCARCRGSGGGPYEDGILCSDVGGSIPEEIDESEAENLREGQKKQITVNAYERNPEARRRCLAHYSRLNQGRIKCEICGFDFGKVYGREFEGKIHIHHIKEISAVGGEYVIDAEKDLIPICPNCHMVAHSRKPALMPEEIRELIRTNRQ